MKSFESVLFSAVAKFYLTMRKKFFYLSNAMEIDGQLIRQVWDKGTPITGQDSELFRLDVQGNWIRKKDYNNTDSIYGWTIFPTDINANDFSKPEKLIPLHTHNNPIPLAGVNHAHEIIFGDKYI